MKNVLVVLLSLVSTSAAAAGAVGYSCIGKNKVNGEAIVFDLLFSDYGRGYGYTNQSISITKKGGIALEKPEVYQMYSATKENNCQTNELGEFYLNNDLDMTPTEEGNLAAYTVQVKADCVDSDEALDLRAYCFFEY